MRVCLISREYPPDTAWGGIATFSYHLALGLAALGHEVEVVTLSLTVAQTQTTDGILVHRVVAEDFPANWAVVQTLPTGDYVLKSLRALWQKFLERHRVRPFDVVDVPEHLAAEGLLVAITRIAPLLVRLYTPFSRFIAERLHNACRCFDHQLVAASERALMLTADVLTSPSQELADYVATYLRLPRETVAIVRNPVDTTVFCPEGPRALASDGRMTVLFVGRLEERKGPRELVQAIPAVLQSCPNVRFVLLGSDTDTGPENSSVKAELETLIHKLGCADAISFHPPVPLGILPQWYRSADVSVVPSVYDNSPYTCLEAMACGRPVVGTTAGGTREYVIDEVSGLIVPPRDPSRLAGALSRLLQDGRLRREMGEQARRRAVEHFSPEEIARQTVSLYELARESFSRRDFRAIYDGRPDCLGKDLEGVLGAFEQSMARAVHARLAAKEQGSWRSLSCRLNNRLTRLVLRIRKRLGKIS